MTFRKEIEEKYFEWLYNYVCKGRSHDKVSYRKLFMYLHNIEFTYLIPNDVNRAKDGIDLRYRFAMLEDNDDCVYILEGPCSVLEMIVALAIRCEETIMDDPRYGDRTAQWFWIMLSNIGIGNVFDDIFDLDYVSRKVEIFLNREYAPNGRGGLFYIRDCTDDLRDVEIWTQLCWYLNTFT